MSGLGLADFLNHNKDRGGAKWLRNWKDDGKIVVWIHTRAPISPVWSHPFIMNGTFKDKDTREERACLRFPRFVSPDAEIVHQEQHFRFRDQDKGPNGHLRTPPVVDPFLILREWLRLEAGHIALDAPVFKWENPNPKRGEDPIRIWTRGQLARLVDKTHSTYSHTLDTKLEYLFVVVDNSAPGDGAQIVRVPKSLGDAMKTGIGQNMESDGDDGNPMINPYGFKWTFNPKASSPMDYYKAFRFNAAPLTPEIREAITSDEYPDSSSQTTPRAGDKARLRAAMEDAAQIELPWDRLFVDAWVDEEAEGGSGTSFDFGANKAKDEAPASSSSSSETATPPAGVGPKTRRRKKKAAPPPPPPEPERMKCDDCPAMLLPTDVKCPQCGAEYDFEGDEAEAATPPPSPSGASGSSTGSTGTSDTTPTSTPNPASETDKCWSCGGKVEGDRCASCGLDVTDDLPFS